MLRILLFVCSLLWGLTTANATSLYHVDVPLNDNTLATEKKAKESAFVDVLIRASGQSDILSNPIIKKAQTSAQRYINQISYGQAGDQRTLKVEFDESRIRNLLAQAEANYWGEPRPDVLFWLVENTVNNREVIWEQSNSDLTNALKTQGTRRGLPVLIPVGDFDDVISISITDLWGGFIEPIIKASTRYSPQGIVILRVYGKGRMQWQFYPKVANMLMEAPITGNVSGSSSEMLGEIVDAVSDYYAQNMSVNLNNAESNVQWVEVSDLHSSSDFFALEKVLSSLNSVGVVRLEVVSGTSALFELNLLAATETFERELGKDKRIQKLHDEADRLSLSSSDENEFVGANTSHTDMSGNIHVIGNEMPSPFPVTSETQQIENVDEELTSQSSLFDPINSSLPVLQFRWVGRR